MYPALVLVAALWPQTAAADERAWTSVEREWHVRAWALDPGAHAEDWALALSSERWTRRVAALDALRRALEVGTLAAGDELLERFEVHALPNLFDARSPALAAALETFAAWPEPDVEPADLAPLVSHPAPTVRVALARFGGAHGGLPAFSALLTDDDSRVVSAALGAWCARPDFHQAYSLASTGSGPRFVDDLQVFERAAVDDRVLMDLAWRSGDGSRRTLFEALRLRHHGTGDVERIVAGWAEVEGMAERQILLRAARAARARGVPLWKPLLARALELAPGEALVWLEGALEAAEPGALLAYVRANDAIDVEFRRELFGMLAGREVEWDADEMRAWLTSEDDALRLAVVQRLAHDVDGDAGAILASALGDSDPTLVRAAAHALCSAADPAPWFDAVHRAWRGLSAHERTRFLEFLPRTPPSLPFRSDLIELARADPAQRAIALELLAEHAGIAAELGDDVRAWLARELQLTLAAEERARREHELGCVALLRWLHHTDTAAAVDDLVGALELVGGVSDEVGKVAIRALGETEAGRATLTPWLAADVRARLRVEAALQLAPSGHERAARVLIGHYGGSDWELRRRSLAVLAGLKDERSSAFLGVVARDEQEEYELRNLAVGGLARRAGGVGALIEVLAGTWHPEVTRAAVRALGALGAMGDEAARAHLWTRLECIEALPLEEATGAEVELARDERDAVLPALVGRGGEAAPVELVRAWARLPQAAAGADLERRFLGQRLPAVEFRWSGELALAGRLGPLGAALEGAGPWWRLDGRLLAKLAETARDPQAAERVRHAARVALAGEGDAPDKSGLELQLLLDSLTSAEARGNWAVFASYAELALRGWQSGRFSDREWTITNGAYRPAEGLDPAARLASARLQALAWRALEGGDLEVARNRARVAQKALGFSSAAREAQRRLEVALGAK